MYPVATMEDAIDLDDDVDAMLETYESLKAQDKDNKKELSRIENELKLRLGEYSKGKTSRNIVTWSTSFLSVWIASH